VAFHERAQEVLVNTGSDCFVITRSINSFRWQQCRCSVYLHTVLREMKTNKNNPTKTVLVISVGFGLLFFVFGFRWALHTALIVGVLGIISNRACDLIDFLWMKLAKILSFIVPNILLSIIFYFFLFPLAVLSGIFGSKNNLQLRNSSDTLWVNKMAKIDKGSFEKMW